MYNNVIRTLTMFSFYCVYVILLLPHVILTQSYAINSCQTPRDKEGECILIGKCSSIASILQSRPVSPENVEYLRKSGCGFEGVEPKVCCPLEIQPSTTTQKPFSNAESLLPSINECGNNFADKILGGQVADRNEYPWMALLEYQTRTGKGFYCGGVLISERYVLTAAHCIKGKDLPTSWRLVSVRLGEYNTSSEVDCEIIFGKNVCSPKPIDVSIESQIAHEDYDPLDINQYHDIALLRLTESVIMTDFIKPICLPRGELINKTFDGVDMEVAGWGKTETKSASDVIMKLRIRIRKNSDCIPIYKNVKVDLDNGQLCAGGLKGQDSCRGDSGGPLMSNLNVNNDQNYYIIGVVSFGPSPCGLQGWPGIYTRVTNYIPWIISKLRP